MAKRVLSVGNCAFDHAAIQRMIETSFDAVLLEAHGEEDAFAVMLNGQIDLVLVNRKLSRDRSDGIEIIKRLKGTSELSSIPVMLVTNYPEYQKQAVEAGAEWGFGKGKLGSPETLEKLNVFLA